MIIWKEHTVSIDSLKPFEANPRKISKENLEELKARIKRDGYHQRVMVTKDFRVIGGHQRIQAFREIGINQIQVLVPDADISDEDFKRMVIQDNLHLGEFNIDALILSYTKDQLLDYGMPKDILRAIRQTEKAGLVDPNDVPAALAIPISKPGDIWLLGSHRLACGDCTMEPSVRGLHHGT